MHQRARAAALLWQSCQATVRQSAVDGQKEMRPSPGPRRAKQGNEHTCGTPRRRTHARLIGRQTRPPPGRAVSRTCERRVTGHGASRHRVLGSGDPSTQSVKPQHDRETGAAQSVSGQTKGFSASRRAPRFEVACTTSDGRNARFRAHHATLFTTATPAPPERAGTTHGGRHVTASAPQSKELILGCPPWRHKRPGPSRRGIGHGSTP